MLLTQPSLSLALPDLDDTRRKGIDRREMEDATTPDDQALRTRKTGDRTPPSAERASTKQKTEVEEAVDTPVASPPPSSGGHATDTGTKQPPAFAERLE